MSTTMKAAAFAVRMFTSGTANTPSGSLAHAVQR
jgi:hypothetical protein